MKGIIRHLSLLVLLSMLATFSAHAIERDSTGVYLIGSTADYNEFCDLVNKGNSFASARVTADGINVTRSIGVGEREYHFRGKFDGLGHTLILNGVPLFEHTQHGCEIRNVNLTGNVTTIGEYTGSLIAYSVSPTIENCNSDVVINVPDTVKAGGLVGYSRGTVTLKGCSFTGQVIGAKDNAGLVGWNEHTAIIKDCQVVGAKALAGNLVEGANIVENTKLDNVMVAMNVKAASVEVADSAIAMKRINRSLASSGTATIDGITYSFTSEGKATVTDVSSSMYSVTIPPTVKWDYTEYTVVAVSSMNSGKNMEDVEIPNTVNKIHNDAFHHCEKLEYVIFADGNTTLDLGYNDYLAFDEQLFEYCPITYVYIGRNLSWDNSEDPPFQTRKKLKYIEFGPLVTVVGNCNGGSDGKSELFDDCDNVEAYYFYGDDRSLGTEITFYCCEGMSDARAAYISRDLKASNFTEYTIFGSGWGISDELTEVKYGPYATYVTSKMYSGIAGTPNNKLTTLYLDEATRLTTIKERAFADCDKLESVNFSNTNLKTIEAEGFYDCDKLANVIFSPVLEKIGRSAFDDTHIINISLPSSLKTLGYKAFYDCDEAVSLSFSPSDEELYCEMEDGMCNTFTDCGELASLYLGRDINWDNKCQKGSPFYDSYFTNVVIDDNVHFLRNYMFQHSNKLKALSIGKNVSFIPDQCFNETEEVQSLILVDKEAPITLGSSCKDFRVRSLYMGRPIADIENVPCAPGSEERTMELLQVGSSVSTIESGTFPNFKRLKTVTLPANITVKGNAFNNCGIEELYVQGDAKLESAAFSKCDKIKEVTVIGKLTMDENAFSPSSDAPAIQNLSVFFKEDPKDESHAQAFPEKILNETTLNNLYDTPYQKVDFSCLPWSGFKNRNSFIANDYAPASEAMANGRYDHAYAQSEHKADKYFTAYMPFDVDSYYFGPDAIAYSLSPEENNFLHTEEDGELTLKASTKYDLDSRFKFDKLVPFLIKSKYKEDIIQATMDQFKERQVEVTYSSVGAESAIIPCYVSNKDEIITPNMGNYYVVDNGCLKKVNGDYTLMALSVAFNAKEYGKLHFADNSTGELLMPDKTQVTPLPDLMGYVTFYSSESCFIVENAEVYTVSQTLDNEGHALLKLNRISDNIVNQGQGVIIKYEPGMALDMQMVTTPSTCTETYKNNVLKGVDVDTPVADLDNVYVLSKVENVVGFFPYAGAVSLNGEDVIPANRAYISSDDVNPGSLPAVVDFDAVTVIDGLSVDSKQSPIYDMSGRRMFNVKKGDIYIKDGKIIIKK